MLASLGASPRLEGRYLQKLTGNLQPMAEGAKEGMTLPLRFAYTESHKSGQGAGKMCLKRSQLFNSDIFVELWRGKKVFIPVVFSPNLLLFVSVSSFLFAGAREKTLKMYIFPSIYMSCCPCRCWNTMCSFPLPLCPVESVCFILIQKFCRAWVCCISLPSALGVLSAAQSGMHILGICISSNILNKKVFSYVFL